VHHHGLRPVLLLDDLQVLLGVHHHDVGGAERGRVDQRQQSLLQAATRDPAVLGGVRGADQVVKHDRHAAARVQQPREVHVEVAEVADDHGIRPAETPGPRREPEPAAGEPGDEPADLPRLSKHVNTIRSSKPKRYVAFSNVESAGGQSLGYGRDARVHRGVVSTENDRAHDVRTLWHGAPTRPQGRR
jgi:hypothetical protein